MCAVFIYNVEFCVLNNPPLIVYYVIELINWRLPRLQVSLYDIGDIYLKICQVLSFRAEKAHL
jgi:hypothetical protein